MSVFFISGKGNFDRPLIIASIVQRLNNKHRNGQARFHIQNTRPMSISILIYPKRILLGSPLFEHGIHMPNEQNRLLLPAFSPVSQKEISLFLHLDRLSFSAAASEFFRDLGTNLIYALFLRLVSALDRHQLFPELHHVFSVRINVLIDLLDTLLSINSHDISHLF